MSNLLLKHLLDFIVPTFNVACFLQDRILYMNREGQALTVRLYDCVECFSSSDHKPVVAIFEVGLRASNDSSKLAAGAFRREVFVEGTWFRNAHLFRNHTLFILSVQSRGVFSD